MSLECKSKCKNLNFIRFYGGIQRGCCLQISVRNSYVIKPVTLTRIDALEILKGSDIFRIKRDLSREFNEKAFLSMLETFVNDDIHE